MRAFVAALFYLVASTSAFANPARAVSPDPADWAAVLDEARGQRVAFNAWGGAPAINAYIQWAAAELEARYGIRLEHVRLTNTTDAVARIVAERAAGRDTQGSVDLIWINGENFYALKTQDLLFGPFAFDLPHFRYVDTEGKPTTLVDFTVPTDGMESPWGMAQFVFFHDTAFVAEPPRSLAALGDWIEAHPGRFTYPAPPDFIGTTFLKQVLLDTVADEAVLQAPVDPATAPTVTAPLWAWLERVTPHLWRQGRSYPADGQALHQLLDDGELWLSMSFNPAEASQLIETGRLPDSVRSFTFDAGTLANTHFVAIPYNSANAAAAMVVADFLLSPEAQAKKQDPRIWGDPTVLDVAALPPADRARFDALPLGVATLAPHELGPARPEPHPSWTDWLQAEWQRRIQG
ncbi:MAG: ABC transporter substrate-binding protein [Geminicoccaceae bacterium]|nr:MAG: ABC transporter substrate-binding protein [Geminicoccaceae bacterium]